MAEINKIQLSDGTQYDIEDTVARNNVTQLDEDKLDKTSLKNEGSTANDEGYSANYLNDKLVSVGATAPTNGEKVWFKTSKNKFNKNDLHIINAYFTVNNPTFQSNTACQTLYMPIEPNKTFTVSKVSSKRFGVGYTNAEPVVGGTIAGVLGGISTETSYTITTGATAQYLAIWFYFSAEDTLTAQQIIDTIQVEEGPIATPYEEFAKPAIYVDGYKIYESN